MLPLTMRWSFAFNHVVGVDTVLDARDLGVGKVLNAGGFVYLGLANYVAGGLRADAVYIGQRDPDLLAVGYGYA